MKDVAEALDRLLSQLSTLLRYVAPGFSALFVVAVTFPDTRSFLLKTSPAVIILAILLGPAIYGIQTGALLMVFGFPIEWIQKKKCPCGIPKEMSKLDEQRWLRRAGDSEPKAIQAEMDRWAALLNFMYSISFTMILIPLTGKIVDKWAIAPEVDCVLVGGLIVLLASLISEWRITRREIEFTVRYPNGKTAGRTEQSGAANSGSAGAASE